MFTASPIAPGRRAPRWAPTLVHARLGIAGVVLGLPAAIVTEFWFSSITLSLVVCAVVVYTVGRLAPELILGPERLRRAAFFAIWPASCVAMVAVVRLAGASFPRTALIAVITASVASGAAGRTIFRRIRAEEETETLDLVVRTIDRFE
jgi:hypothetical protein